MNLKHRFFLLLTGLSFISFSQIENYNYQRELIGVNDTWHKLQLPDEIFSKISPSLADIRIYGITKTNDTVEAPFLLKIDADKESIVPVAFNTINRSHQGDKFYFTFEIPSEEAINQIRLDFEDRNFDWQVQLEGSQDQKEWNSILEDYRIMSIQNEETNFQYSKLNFPSAKFRYLRVMLQSDKQPRFVQASLTQNEETKGRTTIYYNGPVQSKLNKENLTTEIEVKLPAAVPIHQIKLKVNSDFDYYRNVTIKYLSDSVETEKGWKYSYSTLSSGTISSLEDYSFNGSNTVAKNLKIEIENHNNQPLEIEGVKVSGYTHDLIVRFTEEATYFLTYGNPSARYPKYDIARFTDKIPADLSTLELGKEQIIEKAEVEVADPLFMNKNWLWAVMIVIIALLGWFGFKMMKKG